MPELPEVETIARALREGGRDAPAILGSKIRSARIFWPRSLAEPGAEEFGRRVQGQSIVRVGRRAKYLVLSLDLDTLLIHLRMSGDIRIEPGDETDELAQKHDRLWLCFENSLRLAFNDPRKFGRLWLVNDPGQVLGGLGPEPFDPSLDDGRFYQLLQVSHRQIKPLLLDQGFLAGVGNIYSDEALHIAGIHPLTPADGISFEGARHLLAAVREVLEEGIRRNGASIDWVYRGGEFQNHFRVYQRTGQACVVCGAVIERRVIGQRSAHFCPVCQPFTSPAVKPYDIQTGQKS